MREMTPAEQIERSLNKRFRKTLWNPFIAAIKRYELIAPGDRIAVCISGGKDSMLMAKLLQMLQKHSEFPFEVRYLCMDPGYTSEIRSSIVRNAEIMGVPLSIFESDVFEAVKQADTHPCFLCARMRRGCLYRHAQEEGCNKIALGHHLNDVIETTLMSMLYGAQIQGMLPRVRSRNFEGMELIRPLYCVKEQDILAFCRYHSLAFIQCACDVSARNMESGNGSKRQEIKQLIATLKKTNPIIEDNLFAAIHDVRLDTLLGWKAQGKACVQSYMESES